MPAEPNPTSCTTAPEPEPTHDFGAAYREHLPEILAVTDAELVPINLDVRAVVFTVLGSLPEIRQSDEAIRTLPRYSLASYENLEGYAQALYHANALQLGAVPPDDEVGKLYLDSLQRRELLLADTTALVKRGFITAKQVESFRGAPGYKNVSSDLIGLAEVLEAHWPAIDGKTAITLAELQRAKHSAERLVRAASLREQTPAVVAEAQLNRQRAYTLTVRAWDEVRRAIAFIRWHEGDAEQIAPSLWAGRGGRGKGQPANVTAKTEVPSVAETALAEAVPVPVGMPGGSPFLS